MITFDLKFGTGYDDLEFSKDYRNLITEACQILIEIINTDEFKHIIRNYNWHHRRRGIIHGFNHTNTSRSEILSKLLSGNDEFIDEYEDDHNQINDKDIDIWIIPYHGRKKVIGKTNPNTYKTWLNLNYWNTRIVQNKINPILTRIEIAENILHEYCHNLGFGHKGNKRNKHYNIHSVPYALGTEFNKIAIEKYKDNKAIAKMCELDFENEFEVECSFCKETDIT